MTGGGRYELSFLPSAARQVRKLPRDVQKKIQAATEALRDSPHPARSIKVQNADEWRIRIGDYRVTYVIDDEQRRITVAWAGHRRDAYRDLS